MFGWLPSVLNIRPGEIPVVRKLFFIQFLLGIATSFLFVSSLTLFLLKYEIKHLPKVYVASAILLVGFNFLYGFLDARMSAKRLLQYVIVFSGVSIFCFWLAFFFQLVDVLPFLLAIWFMIIYMITGYAFWAVAAVLFNVRESKRLFSIVGSGDIPAKVLGYLSVSILVPLTGVINLLWISVVAFLAAYALLYRFNDAKSIVSTHENHHVPPSSTSFFKGVKPSAALINSIALLSLIAYVAFALLDFTFLAEVKFKYSSGSEIATFIAVFFAIGRAITLLVKIFLSSRLIKTLGLVKTLLIIPAILLSLSIIILISSESINSPIYIFGVMVMLSEILRSALYEPIFFILFQPLIPHDRLRGHLIAKGHTRPLALLPVGIFLVIYLESNPGISILLISEILIAVFICWILAIFLIRNTYFTALVDSIKKGYFRGSELFLKDSSITDFLIERVGGNKPIEIVNSLNLLERSGYPLLSELLIKNIESTFPEVRKFAVTRIIKRKIKEAVPVLRQALGREEDPEIRTLLTTGLYSLDSENVQKLMHEIEVDDEKAVIAAFTGLLLTGREDYREIVYQKLHSLITLNEAGKLSALKIISESGIPCSEINAILLKDSSRVVVRNAIETASITDCKELLPELFTAAATHQLWATLQSALVHYGDDLYALPEIIATTKTDEKRILILAAGKISGHNSTTFLINELKFRPAFHHSIIDALWRKKAVLSNAEVIWLENTGSRLISIARDKVEIFTQVPGKTSLRILTNALHSELKHDVDAALKAYTFGKHGAKFQRVLELMKINDQYRLANGMEALEIAIPNKELQVLNVLVELITERAFPASTRGAGVETISDIVEKIIVNRNTNYNMWSRSVGCYLLPVVSVTGKYDQVLAKLETDDSNLLAETRDYVLSRIN